MSSKPTITLRRIFRSGFLNFWRSPVTTLASIVTLTFTLFVIGALALGGIYLSASLQEIQNRVDISVAFKPDVAETEVIAVKDELALLPEVAAVTYSSREQELADFRARNADNDLILQSLDEVGNPFGARLNIRAVDPAHYDSIAAFLQSDSALSSAGEPIVDQVSFKKPIIDRLIRVIETSRTLGITLTAVLVFISLAVTFTTVSLAIHVSREEIALEKLVGASNSYVRGPFLVEGLIAGLVGAIIALLLLYPSTIWIRNLTEPVFGGLDLAAYFLEHFAALFLTLIGLGAFLGLASSYLAVRKYLRV